MVIKKTPRVAFIHIPKTAGSSITMLFRKAFGKAAFFPGSLLDDFQNLQSGDIEKYRLFFGHMGFKHSESLDGFRFTFLRDPIDRIFSLYNFFAQLPKEYAAKDKAVELAQTYDLEDYVQLEDEIVGSYIDNAQVWQLFESTDPTTRMKHADKAPLDIASSATENAQTLDFVGRFENMDDSIRSLRKRLVIPDDIPLERRNVTPRYKNVSNLHAKAAEALERKTHLDYLLIDAYARRN